MQSATSTEALAARSAAAPGLVGQVTSITLPTLNRATAYRDLNDQRRLRRMRRVVIASADSQRDELQAGGHRVDGLLVTLTYAKAGTWDGRDVSRYLQYTRQWMARRKIPVRYQWVIELTRSGRPHYHVLWWVPKGTRLPMPDKSGHWSKGLSRIERARRPVGYLVKYATKGTNGELPKGGRLFGAGSDSIAVRRVTHLYGLPTWLAEESGYKGRWFRVAHVGWVNVETGECRQSPFIVTVTRDAWAKVVVTIIRKVSANENCL